ncbi:Na+/melibiose symporter-like transporter [alpha proteobacterium HIMB59]|nr:Na+/melibiose symporter-like transporter [alpha proteobacterium HIMB59]
MPLKSLFAYSFQSFYLAGSFLLLFIFLPSFYNLSVGFALSTVGMIILISRVFDVFSDFIIGYLTERRFIKGLPKKNQILLGIFVFIFSIIGLYIIQPNNYYWFIFYYNLALVSYSIAIIPYDSIVIDQKKIQHRRFYIAAIKEIFTILGVLAALIIPTALSKILSVELLNQEVIKITGLIIIILAIIGSILFYLFFEEDNQFHSKFISLKEIKLYLSQNKKISPFAVITFLNLLANNFTANLFIIFVSSYLGLSNYAGPLLILYFLITLISTPVWYHFGKTFSNMFLLQVGTIISIVGFFFVLFTNDNHWYLYLIVVLITGFGVGIDLIVPQTELAEILDQNTQNRLSQIFTALFSMIRKAAIGLAGGIALTGYGYLESNNIVIYQGLSNIMIFYFFIPITIKVIVLLLVMRYRSKFHVSNRE